MRHVRLLVLLALTCLAGCTDRQTVESLQDQVAALRAENAELELKLQDAHERYNSYKAARAAELEFQNNWQGALAASLLACDWAVAVCPDWLTLRARQELPEDTPVVLWVVLLLLGAKLLFVPAAVGLLAGTAWKSSHVINIKSAMPAAERLAEARALLQAAQSAGQRMAEAEQRAVDAEYRVVDAEARLEVLVADTKVARYGAQEIEEEIARLKAERDAMQALFRGLGD